MSLKICINKTMMFQYLFIYIAIQYIGGRVASAVGADIFVGGTLLISTLYLLRNYEILKKEKTFFSFIGILSIFMSLTVFLTFGGLSIATCASLISRFIIVFCAIEIDRKNFADRLVKITYVFAIISLVIFFISQIIGQNSSITLFSNLYEIKSVNVWQGSTYGLFLICINMMDPTRNSYMFGEPGEYQILIMLALYFVAFKSISITKKQKRKYFTVFIITMLTIQSTTGFLSLFVLIVVIFLSSSNVIDVQLKKVILMIALIFTVVMLFYPAKSNIIYTQVFTKLFNETGNLDLSATTGSDRVESIMDLVKIARTSPISLITGVGFHGIVILRGGFSCSGIVNTIIMFGVFTCIILYGSILYSIIKYSKNGYEILLAIFMILNVGLSQPDLLSISTVIIGAFNFLVVRKTNSVMNQEGRGILN